MCVRGCWSPNVLFDSSSTCPKQGNQHHKRRPRKRKNRFNLQGFRTAWGAPKVLKVPSARPTWMRNPLILEWFCFCAGLRLWCWPPCFGQIDDESNETFCDQNPRTQKLIISKPRGQKPQSQHDDFQAIVGLILRFLATRL